MKAATQRKERTKSCTFLPSVISTTSAKGRRKRSAVRWRSRASSTCTWRSSKGRAPEEEGNKTTASANVVHTGRTTWSKDAASSGQQSVSRAHPEKPATNGAHHSPIPSELISECAAATSWKEGPSVERRKRARTCPHIPTTPTARGSRSKGGGAGQRLRADELEYRDRRRTDESVLYSSKPNDNIVYTYMCF